MREQRLAARDPSLLGALLGVLLVGAVLALDVSARLGATVVAVAAAAFLGALAVRTQVVLTRANRELRDAQARMSRQARLQEIAGEVGRFGGWIADVRQDTIHWSEEVARIHGLTPDAQPDVGTGVSYYVPEDQPRIAQAYARCVSHGTPFNEELQLVRQDDGALRWVNAIGRAEHNENGEVIHVHGALQDITDRIEAQLAAETSRRRLEALGASMPFVIWTARADGALDYLSEEFWRATGILPHDALGDAWVEAVHPHDRERALARWEQSVATGDPYLIEFRVQEGRAGHRWHLVRATADRTAAGEIARWWGSSLDVHDTRTLQEEATALAAQLSDTLESIGDAVLTLDTDWRVTFVNSQGERLLQHAREELIGRNLWMLFPEAIGSVFQQEYERAVTERRPVTFGAPFAPLDLHLEVSAYPHHGGLTIYFRDVSERRLLDGNGGAVHESAGPGNRRAQTVHPGEGVTVRVDKDAVTETLRARGDHDRAAQADTALPRSVDTEHDAGLLHQFDLNVSEVEAAEAVVETESS